MTRDELIEKYAYLVPLTRQRVYPVPPARIAAEDLEGEGYLGLVRAADRYDPARGTAFKSWAIRADEQRQRIFEWIKETGDPASD